MVQGTGRLNSKNPRRHFFTAPTDSLNEQWLEDESFDGFLPFAAINRMSVPTKHGVYAVVRRTLAERTFLVPGSGRGGTHYPLPLLEAAWVPNAEVLYFGRAKCKAGIYERLDKYARFGRGRNSGHSGGRAIWQLEDAQELIVCWFVTDDRDPAEAEDELIERFKKLHNGSRPFANRIDAIKKPSLRIKDKEPGVTLRIVR